MHEPEVYALRLLSVKYNLLPVTVEDYGSLIGIRQRNKQIHWFDIIVYNKFRVKGRRKCIDQLHVR